MTRMKLTPGDVEYTYSVQHYHACTVHLMVGEAWGHAAAEVRTIEIDESDTAVRAELELAVYDALNDQIEARHRATTRPHDIL